MKFLFACLCLTLAFLPASTHAFEIRQNDRLVLLGSTLIEQEQQYGLLETTLQLAQPGTKFTVRNLAWSGDTVYGHARSYFGPPKEGFERLGRNLEELKPTVLIASYGADMAFADTKTIPDFIKGYGALLDLARAKSPGVRIVIVSPTPLESLGAPLPDMKEPNARLAAVRDALKAFAGAQSATFVDAFELMNAAKADAEGHLTSNGLHYMEAGYRLYAGQLAQALGQSKVDLNSAVAKEVRKEVIRKDFLFFNRWRPANETYLFGFRKHEQGQNAKEMAQFDPLVDAVDQKIAALKSGHAKLP